jgi:hypothetical protein
VFYAAAAAVGLSTPTCCCFLLVCLAHAADCRRCHLPIFVSLGLLISLCGRCSSSPRHSFIGLFLACLSPAMYTAQRCTESSMPCSAFVLLRACLLTVTYKTLLDWLEGACSCHLFAALLSCSIDAWSIAYGYHLGGLEGSCVFTHAACHSCQ